MSILLGNTRLECYFERRSHELRAQADDQDECRTVTEKQCVMPK